MGHESYGSPEAWAAGPDLVYGALAEAALAQLPVFMAPQVRDPTPARVLDAGTGTGAFARALRRGGAAVVALDASLAMLRHHRDARPPALAGDLVALPLRDHCCDAAVAGFVLSHLHDPARGLAELIRVTRLGGTVLVTAFPAVTGTPSHPAKVAVDEVLASYRYRPPDWYAELKHAGEERVGSESGLSALATAAGLDAVRVDRVEVDLTGLGNATLVRWRLGMAQVAPWLRAQDRTRRDEIAHAARAALDPLPPAPLPMLVLRGTPP
jgi:ubiquinone/menaquinone biosynthesis C-methylase UbiE